MKKMLSIVTAALLAVGMSTTAFAADINVTVDGTSVAWTDAKPFIDENSRTLVPLRPIANALGLDVAWNDDTNTASFTDGATTAEFTVNSPKYHCFLNDMDIHVYLEMDTTPVIADSRIYAPARYLAECFSYDVSWDQATQTVALAKAEVPEEEAIRLPKVPAGEFAAAFPVTAEAGTYAKTYIAFAGVTLVEDPDIFEYSIDAETPINGFGMDYGFTDEYVEMDMAADLSVAPGTYPVTFTIPQEFFADATEDIVVSTTLTVTAPNLESIMEKVLEELEWGVETTYGANAVEITEAIYNSTAWLFDGTPFQLTLTDGDWSYDSEGNIIRELWECTATLTNAETGDSVSVSNVLIPLTFDPDSAW